jgi:hypothetical protein
MSLSIATQFCSLLKIPAQLKNVVSAYLLSLALNTSEHTQTFASEVSGLNKSQFSRLLRKHSFLAKDSLVTLSQDIARIESCDRKPLVAGTPWTVGIIIDATLHGRSSLHVHNAQRFNHGQGFIVGHQWTNVVLTIGDEIIPLPPIPFLSKNECKRRKIAYQTEHELVIEYLRQLNLNLWVGVHDPSEILVLMDSGYDDKEIQNTILSRGWDFICSLKCNRSTKSVHNPDRRTSQGWKQIRELFRLNRKYAPWETVRTQSASKKKTKRKTFRLRRIEGFIRGIIIPVVLVCSKKSRGKGNVHFACSNLTISTRSISLGYAIRWRIELFHRDSKQHLGMMDAGVHNFESLISHIHWVYCAYLLLKKQIIKEQAKGFSILHRQQILTKKWESQRYKHIIQLTTRFDGVSAIKNHCYEVLAKFKSA